MVRFNSNGLLVPDSNIQSNVIELEKVFVTSLPSRQRKELFLNYTRYSTSLKELCGSSTIVQWIDGSFATKKLNPGDIDLVTSIDFAIAEKLNHDLINYKYPYSKIIFGVDAYLIKVYPAGHQFRQSFPADRAYWLEHFSKTKRNRIGNKLKKGFLEINL